MKRRGYIRDGVDKKRTTDTNPSGFHTKTGRIADEARRPLTPGQKSKTSKWTGKEWSKTCRVCGKAKHEGGCFRCGHLLSSFVYGDNRNTTVRQTARPKKGRVGGRKLVIYDHEGADLFDARAIVVVGALRLTGGRTYSKCANNSPAWITWLRTCVEKALGVRPRLDNPDHAECEVADLLRAKAAVAVLSDDYSIGFNQRLPDTFGLNQRGATP